MSSATQLLEIAKKHLGQGGSTFRKYCGLPSGAAWCNAFVTYVFHEGGESKLYCNGTKQTYCPNSIKWCKKNLAQVPLYLVLPCDVIYFDWERNGVPNHIGFVRAKRDTSSIYTIEGNTDGGRVANKTRAAKYVQAVYRPHFKPTYTLGKLTVDGDFGYSSIAGLQKLVGATVDGVLGIGTVKKVQAYCKATADGQWGNGTSKKLQSKMAKEGYYTGAIDGAFGAKSVKALQRMINAKCFTDKPKPKPEPKPTPTESGYTGTFPTLPPKTAKLAVECAYAYGTKLSKYKYKGGSPKAAYKKRLNEAYPNRKSWKYAKSRAGASCDVFAGTVLKCSGYKSAPHAMSKMVAWCKKHLKAVKTMQNGDILTRTNHVMIVVDLKGKKRVANAHFQDHGGTYGIIQAVGKYTNIWRPSGVSYFSKGDTFTDVKKLQKFLNWYGGYGLKEDYAFSSATESAVKDFQKREGLEVINGRFGSKELAKAKACKK